MGAGGPAMFPPGSGEIDLVTAIIHQVLRATRQSVTLLCGVTIESAVLWVVFAFEVSAR